MEFHNDIVDEQRRASNEALVSNDGLSRVLVIYTGGTIGMKKHIQDGYVPAAGFLTQTLSTMRRFHDLDSVSEGSNFPSRLASTSDGFTPDNEEAFNETNPVNLPLHYVSFSDDGAAGRMESGRTQPDGEPVVLINGTPVIRQKLPALLTPISLYGKRVKYSVLEYTPLMDSSCMTMKDWSKIATDIEVNYALYDAFVILHGTDTMAYTASALSFMLEDLGKTVILTGSQVPLSEVRNDAVENLLGALTIAGHFVIPEVTLFFAQKLYRGNRTSKVNAFDFNAFDSPNCQPLATVGINIEVSWDDICRPKSIAKFKAVKKLNPSVAALRLFPGITDATVRAFLSPPIAGVVLETFGSGNAPSNRAELLQLLKEGSDRGVVIVNCTQCSKGLVSDLYETGKALLRIGVVPGSDMTTECALTKLSYLLGKDFTPEKCRELMRENLRGELTVVPHRMQFTPHTKTSSVIQSVIALLGSSAANGIATDLEQLDPTEVTSIEKALVPMLLCNACRVGDLNGLRRVAQNYENLISLPDYDGRTPLHIAASENQPDALKILLSHGANVHIRDRFGHSALFDAVKLRQFACAEILKKAGAHFSEEESQDITAMVAEAASRGELTLIKFMVECGVDLNVQWIDGRTVIHLAVLRRRLQVIQFCIDYSEQVLRARASSRDDTNSAEISTFNTAVEIRLDVRDNFGLLCFQLAESNFALGNSPLDNAISMGWQEGISCLQEGRERLKLARLSNEL